MAYEITATFRLRLPDDLEQMGTQLTRATEAWRQFVEVIDGDAAEVHFALGEVRPKRGRPSGGNGAARRQRKPKPGAFAQEPLVQT